MSRCLWHLDALLPEDLAEAGWILDHVVEGQLAHAAERRQGRRDVLEAQVVVDRDGIHLPLDGAVLQGLADSGHTVSRPTADDLNPTEPRSEAWVWVVVLAIGLLLSILLNIALLAT